MRARVLLWVCLGLNILLATMIVLISRDSAPVEPLANAIVQTNDSPKKPRTHVVVRRQGFSWSEIESADFPAYIANLRRIGCPERTIRDIIVAEVTELFSDRMAKEIQLPEQKWWLPDPDMDVLQAGMDQVHALDLEKAQLLTQLLGPGWQSQRPIAGAGAIRFDGAVLGKLPSETKSSVERIEAAARRKRAELEERARQENKTTTPAELESVRQETRRELASILNPEQLEEYMLRYSQTADQLRSELRGFGADADEFRRIFRARDAYEQQVVALSGNDLANAARRTELDRTRDEALRQSIGPERYALYQMSQNPLFRQAQEQTEQNGAPAEKVIPIFRINQAVQEETSRIQADQSISEDQRRVALAAVQQQQKNSIDRILADEMADPAQELEAASEPLRGNRPVLPPFPWIPGSVGTDQPSRVGLPPGADLPPGVNQTTKGPGYPRRR